jgi:2-polyprenyl-3-methyl-5-hydroxy-6-metoxy-1,4-benzoquinol methylase
MNSERTSRFFDGYARDFDAIYGTKNTLVNRVVNRLFRECMRMRYELTLEGCAPIEGASVLDIGCGPGHYSVALARKGAGDVLGVDFADGMIDIAKKHAGSAAVDKTCRFQRADFMTQDFGQKFDYSILMGFMDYMENPKAVVRRALSLSRRKAFFSFPLDGGVIALQRKIRYRFRCDLFLYTEAQVRALFDGEACSRIDTKRIERDLFVTAHVA